MFCQRSLENILNGDIWATKAVISTLTVKYICADAIVYMTASANEKIDHWPLEKNPQKCEDLFHFNILNNC